MCLHIDVDVCAEVCSQAYSGVTAGSWNSIVIRAELIAWERTDSLFKRYYMCSRSPSLCLTGALGMKGKSSGKRDIGSRHGEVFVSILSIPSLSRNPNFHHSPTYRQIKAAWRGGFPQLRQLVTSLHKGEAAQSSVSERRLERRFQTALNSNTLVSELF